MFKYALSLKANSCQYSGLVPSNPRGSGSLLAVLAKLACACAAIAVSSGAVSTVVPTRYQVPLSLSVPEYLVVLEQCVSVLTKSCWTESVCCARCSVPVRQSTLLSTCSWRIKSSWQWMYFPMMLPEYWKYSSKGKSSEYVKYSGMRLKALCLSTRSLQLLSTQASLPCGAKERSGGLVPKYRAERLLFLSQLRSTVKRSTNAVLVSMYRNMQVMHVCTCTCKCKTYVHEVRPECKSK